MFTSKIKPTSLRSHAHLLLLPCFDFFWFPLFYVFRWEGSKITLLLVQNVPRALT